MTGTAALTRRCRVAAVTAHGALATTQILWPTHGQVAFEEFATHPYSVSRPVGDVGGHSMAGMMVWDGVDGVTPLIWIAYGGYNSNVSPTWIVPLNPATAGWETGLAFAANCFGYGRFYVYDGSIWAPSSDGNADYMVGVPNGSGGIDWANKIAITAQAWSAGAGFDHPFSLAFRDTTMWQGGQDLADRVIWQGPLYGEQPAGSIIRHEVKDTAEGRISIMFVWEGELHYQGFISGNLFRWDADTTWVDTGLNISHSEIAKHEEWHGKLWFPAAADGVRVFDGTVVTDFDVNVRDLSVGDDDAMYAVASDDTIYRCSTPGAVWRPIGTVPGAVSCCVLDGFIYVGDDADTIWRAELGAWGLE